jgi:hypothetical protein
MGASEQGKRTPPEAREGLGAFSEESYTVLEVSPTTTAEVSPSPAKVPTSTTEISASTTKVSPSSANIAAGIVARLCLMPAGLLPQLIAQETASSGTQATGHPGIHSPLRRLIAPTRGRGIHGWLIGNRCCYTEATATHQAKTDHGCQQ